MLLSFGSLHPVLPRLDSKETNLLDSLFLADDECCRANHHHADYGIRAYASDYRRVGMRTLFIGIVDPYIFNCQTEEKSDMANSFIIFADVCLDLYSYRIPSGPSAYIHNNFHGAVFLPSGYCRTDSYNGVESE